MRYQWRSSKLWFGELQEEAKREALAELRGRVWQIVEEMFCLPH